MKAIKPQSLVVMLSVLFLVGCNSIPKHKVHYTVLDQVQSSEPKKILLLPMDVTVAELTAGGQQEEVESWTTEAKEHLELVVRSDNHNLSRYSFVEMPELLGEEQVLVDQHLALLDVVGGNSMTLSRGPGGVQAWAHKTERFDYTIGPGLDFLREKTGADVALMIYGDDLISSGGRKATFILAAAFGVGIPMGHAGLVGTLVDLNTGNVLWVNYEVTTTDVTLRRQEDVTNLVTKLFDVYPGIESYKNYLNKTSKAN